MKHFILTVCAVLAVNAFALSPYDDEEIVVEEYQVEEQYGQWQCEADNTRRTGPYFGYGPTERAAKAEALHACHEASFFRCWIVAGSCYEK